MKKFKKLSAILLAMIMTMLVALPAMAAGTTVTLPTEGPNDYVAYKIFDLEQPAGKDLNTPFECVYKIDKTSEMAKALWTNPTDGDLTNKKENEFFNAKQATEAGKLEVTWGGTEVSNNKDTLARQAAEFLKDLILTNPTLKQEMDTSYKTELGTATSLSAEGYYLIYSATAGTAGLALASTDTTIDLNDKITRFPSITKKIAAVNGIDKAERPLTTTASIGDEITFEIIVKVPDAFTTPLTIVDNSEQGLDIDTNSIKVVNSVTSAPECTIDTSVKKDVRTFTVKVTPTMACDYTITYNAKLVGTGVINKYNNTATMTYDNVANKVSASVVTNLNPEGGNDGKEEGGAKGPWSLLKVDNTKTNHKLLTGAKFQICKDADCKKPYQFKYDDAHHRYTAATDGTLTEIDLTGINAINGPNDKPLVDIVGLAGTVYIKETQAPAGYNKLQNVIKLNLDGNASTNGNIAKDANGVITVDEFPGKIGDRTSGTWNETGSKGLAIVNTTGALLPSTGGIGTTIFYIAGAILLLGAVVMLVVRRRMDK